MTSLVGLISGIAVVSLISALLVILVSPSRAIQSRFVRRFVEYVGNVEMDSTTEEPSSLDRGAMRSFGQGISAKASPSLEAPRRGSKPHQAA